MVLVGDSVTAGLVMAVGVVEETAEEEAVVEIDGWVQSQGNRRFVRWRTARF